jgi:hypothetical protein
MYVRAREENVEANPLAWRTAVKILELRYGSAPAEPENETLLTSSADVARLTWREMQVVAARLLGELAPAEPAPSQIDGTRADAMPPVVTD